MATRDNITQVASSYIDKYSTNREKNRVCIFCGFENTNIENNIGYCNTCNKSYKLINDKITSNNNCCIIS